MPKDEPKEPINLGTGTSLSFDGKPLYSLTQLTISNPESAKLLFGHPIIEAADAEFDLSQIKFGPLQPQAPEDRLYYFEFPNGARRGPYRVIEQKPGTDEEGNATLDLVFQEVKDKEL